jgi:hypothetical protein
MTDSVKAPSRLQTDGPGGDVWPELLEAMNVGFVVMVKA